MDDEPVQSNLITLPVTFRDGQAGPRFSCPDMDPSPPAVFREVSVSF